MVTQKTTEFKTAPVTAINMPTGHLHSSLFSKNLENPANKTKIVKLSPTLKMSGFQEIK